MEEYGKGTGFFTDPVHQNEEGKWAFWDETWSDSVGSYDTEEEARKALKEYCEQL
jgi:hypothetical protein